MLWKKRKFKIIFPGTQKTSKIFCFEQSQHYRMCAAFNHKTKASETPWFFCCNFRILQDSSEQKNLRSECTMQTRTQRNMEFPLKYEINNGFQFNLIKKPYR